MAATQVQPIEIKVPALIAGWPGMGNVGLGAADYLRRKLGAKLCARIDTSRLFFPDAIEVDSGIGRIPAPPSQSVYLVQDPPLFVFEGETQASGEAGVLLANSLLDFAQANGVERVYTGAAFATPMSFREPSRVLGVATDERLKDAFSRQVVEPLTEGRITGLNGLLLGLAGARDLPAACFLATMPHYAIQTHNPKASKALLRVFERILGIQLDMTEINTAIAEVDRLLGEFEAKVNAALEAMRQQAQNLEAGDAGSDGREEDGRSESRPEPHVIMDRIEQLFELVRNDRSKAPLLKQELDRWGLFSVYEDRFLDLFAGPAPGASTED